MRLDLLERLRLVGDLHLEERDILDDGVRPLLILYARQLDDNAVGAFLLNDRFRHAELVNARANDLERTVDRVAHVRNASL